MELRADNAISELEFTKNASKEAREVLQQQLEAKCAEVLALTHQHQEKLLEI